ncbi:MULTISPECIES: hypothetical protein [Aeromonas]|uniref:Uncharacterized protein n=1 Tax=Aeromonas caviae TaxID=648 RepID=A0AA42VGJ9_AERCA|nr:MULTISPECIES: hypothetical protein [Aeromonas]HEB5079317.1 hypothetical protein [Aeromonas hydrophila subsp. hydrophila]MCW4617933.1 hypothetical protein [Aeromonas hydrophila]MDH0309607.1 hypothetical protein [Aeromonas caviae]MDH0319826.1 hypothetical protein [Aeromonas caviae]MDH0360417.1 hypothetical protein [Aeromonas caviae]
MKKPEPRLDREAVISTIGTYIKLRESNEVLASSNLEMIVARVTPFIDEPDAVALIEKFMSARHTSSTRMLTDIYDLLSTTGWQVSIGPLISGSR